MMSFWTKLFASSNLRPPSRRQAILAAQDDVAKKLDRYKAINAQAAGKNLPLRQDALKEIARLELLTAIAESDHLVGKCTDDARIARLRSAKESLLRRFEEWETSCLNHDRAAANGQVPAPVAIPDRADRLLRMAIAENRAAIGDDY